MANYVDKNEMISGIRHYKNTGIITEELGTIFYNIAERYTKKLYSQYHFPWRLVDDLISDSLLRIIVKIDKFRVDDENCNPFAYCTQLVHNQIIGSLKKERKNYDTINKIKEQRWQELSEFYGIENNESYEANKSKKSNE